VFVCDAVLARLAVFAAPSAYGCRCQSIINGTKGTGCPVSRDGVRRTMNKNIAVPKVSPSTAVK
jgi:hypothetical protein